MGASAPQAPLQQGGRGVGVEHSELYTKCVNARCVHIHTSRGLALLAPMPVSDIGYDGYIIMLW